MKRLTLFAILVLGLIGLVFVHSTNAVENPQNSSLGLEATIPGEPPTKAATITTPSNGATVTSIPINVGGLCQTGLLVKIFTNNVFVGSTMCTKGSYLLKIDLFSGKNELVARVYDALDQGGPDSNKVTVTFNDAQFTESGTRVTITSLYARRGANPGDELSWPITIDGGVAPYALSVDWGDTKADDLQSVSSTGLVTIKHVYDTAGTYNVVVKVSDKNGNAGYLQLVGVANGAVQSNITSSGKDSETVVETKVVWWPLLVSIPLLLATFWLGRRHELYTLRKHLESQ